MKNVIKLKKILLLALTLCCVCACKKSKSESENESKFNQYVSAFTSGTISVQSHIRITLAAAIDSVAFVNEAEKLFDFSPSIKGKTFLADDNTIEFVPAEPLKPTSEYSVTFNLYRILPQAKGDEKKFNFTFYTIKPSFTKEIIGIEMIEGEDDMYSLSGSIFTADITEKEKVEKILNVKSTDNYGIAWTHAGNTHGFKIDKIKSKQQPFNIMLAFNGKPINYDFAQTDTIKIPAIGDFSLINVEVVKGDTPYFICRFSKNIDTRQNLAGLITVSNCTDVSYKIEGNKVLVYPACTLRGSQTATIYKGIKSTKGKTITEKSTREVVFEVINPEVKFVSKGNILPNSNGLILPFQAVNLKAVNVKVIKIYENNIMQFLQVNTLAGSNQMKRAGRLVKMQTIKLGDENAKKLANWATYSLDLTNLITPEPGAIYRIILSFTQSQAIYPCNGAIVQDEDFESGFADEEAKFDKQTSVYYDDEEGDYEYYSDSDDYYGESSSGYYGSGYKSWDEYYAAAKNPCERAYYREQTPVACNILASNLGVVAKVGKDKKVNVAVSNLVSAQPMGSVAVEIFNYQHQLIGQNKTSSDGLAEIPIIGVPFLLVATSGNQKGYLRLDDASSLNMSGFDVSGNVVEKGLKGYIYGERGVWRPGDTLFINFILQDVNDALPKNHPVNFELVNPLGQTIVKQTKTGNQHNFFAFTVPMSSDAPTGNWMVYAKVGGAQFSKRIKIETIKPNRLKMNFVIDDDSKNGSGFISGTLTAKWLHGAPAKNLKAEIIGKISRLETTFAGYDDYVFDNDVSSYTSEIDVFKNKLNADGEATIEESFGDNRPGTLNVRFVMRVYEESGNFSIGETSETFKTYNSYIGLKQPQGNGYYNTLYTDQEYTYNLACVNAKGKPQSCSNVKVEVYKTDWSWWWSSYNGRSVNYSQRKYYKLMATRNVNVANGSGAFKYKIPRDEWGYYQIVAENPENGQKTVMNVYISWPEWEGELRFNEDGGEKATELVMSSDKKTYKVGEKAVIKFPSSEGARALVSVENGTSVNNIFWIDCNAKETELKIDITKNMLPNAFVSVMHIQKHANTVNDLPIRLYGTIPILVEDEDTKLKPQIEMPSTLRPEQKFTVKVSEANNKPMSYTLAIVDEGLLDITNFKTPNAWASFFAREALGVRTFDLYDFVIGAYGGKIEQIFAIGGDGDLNAGGNKNKINRFKPVVKVLGPFVLDGKSNTHEITMPNYVGSVRAMVVAGNGKAFGSAEKSVEVKKPLMVIATLPRVLGPNETVDLSADVFAMEKFIKNAKVEVIASDIFEISGDKTKSVSFSQVGDEVIPFSLKTKNRVGAGKVKVIATSGNEKSEYDIEIEVRASNPKTYAIESKLLKGGETWTGTYNLTGMEGTNKVSIEYSSFPPLNFANRMSYLLGYPHGCIEQTTSKAFPQLFLADVMDMTAEQKEFASNNVKSALYRLRSFMLSNGSFSYWPGQYETNSWGTSYAGQFLIEAEKKGFSVPASMKTNWITYQTRTSNSWEPYRRYGYGDYEFSYFDQAYRLYTLALAGQSNMGAMNRLKGMSPRNITTNWLIAATYALAGQTQTAKNIAQYLTSDFSTYQGYYTDSYGSRERDMAMVVETMHLIKEDEKAFVVAKKISEALNSNEWMSTQTTAYCLMSLAKFATDYKTGGMDFSYIDGAVNNVKTDNSIWNTKIKDVKIGGQFSTTNKSDKMIFVSVLSEGIPAPGNEKANSNGLSISVSYYYDSNNYCNEKEINQGDDFVAEVIIRNTSSTDDYTNLVLTQIFPSGWEIINDRITSDTEETPESSSKYLTSYDYKDIRDDRVYIYFDLAKKESAKYKVKLNASYIGRYYLPAVSCEAMYDTKISANTEGTWVTVK